MSSTVVWQLKRRTLLVWTLAVCALALIFSLVSPVSPARAAEAASDASDGVAAPASTQRVESDSGQIAAAKQTCKVSGNSTRKRPCVKLKLAKKTHAQVPSGKHIRVKGKVRHPRAAKVVKIQELKGGGRWGHPKHGQGKWKTVAKKTHHGKFSKKLKSLKWGAHRYRAKVKVKASSQALVRAQGSGSAVSNTVDSAAGAYGYAYQYTNSTGDDLQIQYGGKVGDAKAADPLSFNNGNTVSALNINAPSGAAFGATLLEVGGWESTYSFYANGGDNPCQNLKQPALASGDVVKVVFEDQTFGYKGTMTYPNGSSCTFEMLTGFQTWVTEHPVWTVIIGVVAIVAIVAITVFSGGTADAAALDAASVVGEGEVEVDAFEGMLVYFDEDIELIEENSSYMSDSEYMNW
ncbi:hypothetical protein N9D66_00210 [Candidatus Nanopelagicales bacterium]|nr:hypothetical protein [Candidatus Nanopelagicales bacterium]